MPFIRFVFFLVLLAFRIIVNFLTYIILFNAQVENFGFFLGL